MQHLPPSTLTTLLLTGEGSLSIEDLQSLPSSLTELYIPILPSSTNLTDYAPLMNMELQRFSTDHSIQSSVAVALLESWQRTLLSLKWDASCHIDTDIKYDADTPLHTLYLINPDYDHTTYFRRVKGIEDLSLVSTFSNESSSESNFPNFFTLACLPSLTSLRVHSMNTRIAWCIDTALSCVTPSRLRRLDLYIDPQVASALPNPLRRYPNLDSLRVDSSSSQFLWPSSLYVHTILEGVGTRMTHLHLNIGTRGLTGRGVTTTTTTTTTTPSQRLARCVDTLTRYCPRLIDLKLYYAHSLARSHLESLRVLDRLESLEILGCCSLLPEDMSHILPTLRVWPVLFTFRLKLCGRCRLYQLPLYKRSWNSSVSRTHIVSLITLTGCPSRLATDCIHT